MGEMKSGVWYGPLEVRRQLAQDWHYELWHLADNSGPIKMIDIQEVESGDGVEIGALLERFYKHATLVDARVLGDGRFQLRLCLYIIAEGCMPDD